MDRVEQNRLIRERLKETVFCVEATSYESFCLWKEWHEKVLWEQENPGFLETVGHIDNNNYRPVCIELSWDRIDGCLVLFWDATSRFVDHEMIDAWFHKNCSPMYDNGTRLAHANARNFHLCIHAVREAATRKSAKNLQNR